MANRNWIVSMVLLFLAILACGPGAERPPLTFSPPELPDAQVGVQYEITITVSDNVTPVFSISVDSAELPPGLTLQYEDRDASASIAGIPEASGEFAFTVSAACFGTSVNGQTGQQRYVLHVKE
jgi:hypothetical protein